MTGHEIRKSFLKFFERNGHTIVKSSSLVPKDDPTLMFTNAGMVQFKSVFLGRETRPYKRATSSQKCLRVSGKHNDLENVGRTARHHTFFEMLGNFSFGDYFKKEAIAFGWIYLTEELGLPKDRFWVTIFKDDDEAFEYWREWVPAERIVRMGEKDNFWAMGDTGPCGPCSEIIIDQGPGVGCGREECDVHCECDRFLELWNLVFMQYDQKPDGTREPLPRPCIDTGMGLERLAAVLQGETSNFHIDLFRDLFEAIQSICGIEYGKDEEDDVSMRVIADHSRAAAFLVSDGVLPANEGRGYELRRIMRRALRHGKRLGLKEPFIFEMVKVVARVMAEPYPELMENIDYISRVVLSEEEAFLKTLDRGISILKEEIRSIKEEGRDIIPGQTIFTLYDTYGFPPDLVQDIANENELRLDMEAFRLLMDEQRRRSREHWAGSGEELVKDIYLEIASRGISTRFTGYDRLEDRGRVLSLIVDGREMESVREGESVEIITDVTPFYGKAGGQVGDTGEIRSDNVIVEVQHTLKPLDNLIVHQGVVKIGVINRNDEVLLKVDESRKSTMRHHTATHLLQWALRRVLGEHVKQAGSEVGPERLRFDFTHFSALTEEEIGKVEDLINEKIRENHSVRTEVLPYQDALERGAIAIFEEKYGDVVRLVSIGDFSKELCGGTHVSHTGEIGVFKIIREGSIGQSLRRIEAVAGAPAIAYIRKQESLLKEAGRFLNSAPDDLLVKLQSVLAELKSLKKEVESLKSRLITYDVNELVGGAEIVDGVKVLAAKVDAVDQQDLLEYSDKLRDRLKSGVIVLGTAWDDKVALVAQVTKDLAGKLDAGLIMRRVAELVGGKGGGRREMARGGGHDVQRLPFALTKVKDFVKEMLS